MRDAVLDEEITLPEAMPRVRLIDGALELIELAGVRPLFVGNVNRMAALDFLSKITGYFTSIIGDGISKVSGLLADIIHFPATILTDGIDLVLLNFASIVVGVPVIGEFVAAILIATDAVLKFVISLPELVLRQVQTLGEAIKTLTPEQAKTAFTSAMTLINTAAPPEIRDAVAAAAKDTPANYGVEVEPSFTEYLVGAAAALGPVAVLALAA